MKDRDVSLSTAPVPEIRPVHWVRTASPLFVGALEEITPKRGPRCWESRPPLPLFTTQYGMVRDIAHRTTHTPYGRSSVASMAVRLGWTVSRSLLADSAATRMQDVEARGRDSVLMPLSDHVPRQTIGGTEPEHATQSSGRSRLQAGSGSFSLLLFLTGRC